MARSPAQPTAGAQGVCQGIAPQSATLSIPATFSIPTTTTTQAQGSSLRWRQAARPYFGAVAASLVIMSVLVAAAVASMSALAL